MNDAEGAVADAMPPEPGAPGGLGQSLRAFLLGLLACLALAPAPIILILHAGPETGLAGTAGMTVAAAGFAAAGIAALIASPILKRPLLLILPFPLLGFLMQPGWAVDDTRFSVATIIGAGLVAGLGLVLVAVRRDWRAVVARLPLPVVEAAALGALAALVLDLPPALEAEPVLLAGALAGFALHSLLPRRLRLWPGPAVALAGVGAAALAVTLVQRPEYATIALATAPAAGIDLALTFTLPPPPAFSPRALFALALPWWLLLAIPLARSAQIKEARAAASSSAEGAAILAALPAKRPRRNRVDGDGLAAGTAGMLASGCGGLPLAPASVALRLLHSRLAEDHLTAAFGYGAGALICAALLMQFADRLAELPAPLIQGLGAFVLLPALAGVFYRAAYPAPVVSASASPGADMAATMTPPPDLLPVLLAFLLAGLGAPLLGGDAPVMALLAGILLQALRAGLASLAE